MDINVYEHKALPGTVILAIWLTKNEMNFQGKELIPFQVSQQVKYAYEGIWKPQ